MWLREKAERKRDDAAVEKRGGPDRRPFAAAVACAVSGASRESAVEGEVDELEEELDESLLLLSLSCCRSRLTSTRMSSAAAKGCRHSGHGAVFSRGTKTRPCTALQGVVWYQCLRDCTSHDACSRGWQALCLQEGLQKDVNLLTQCNARTSLIACARRRASCAAETSTTGAARSHAQRQPAHATWQQRVNVGRFTVLMQMQHFGKRIEKEVEAAAAADDDDDDEFSTTINPALICAWLAMSIRDWKPLCSTMSSRPPAPLPGPLALSSPSSSSMAQSNRRR